MSQKVRSSAGASRSSGADHAVRTCRNNATFDQHVNNSYWRRSSSVYYTF